MTRTKKQTHNGDERAALILELFRQLPDNKFSLRHLASASGGASKEGRRETMQIVEQLLATGVIESCPRDKYRLSPAQRPRLEGTVEMLTYRLDVRACRRHGAAGLRPLAQLAERSRRRPRATGAHAQGTGFQRPRRRDHARSSNAAANATSARPKSTNTMSSCVSTRARCPFDVYLHKRDCPEREKRRQGRRTHRRMGARLEKPRGRTGRHSGQGGRERHRDARHSGRIRPPLPLRAGGRGGSRSHRRAHHPQRLRRAARLPADGDLHRRSGRRQGLRRRAVGPQSPRRRVGGAASISPT